MPPKKASKRSATDNENDGTRQRRRRTSFTDEQLDRFEETFEKEKFPGIQIREDLARELNIGEDRIQVWFQNRRARWRKHEIKNKPAPGILQSENRQPICDVTPRTIFQTSPVIFPPLHSVPFRPWEPFYAPFSTTHWIPPRETLEFSHCHNTAAQVTQAANEMFQLLGSASATRSPSPTSSLATLYQASWVYDSDSGESHHSTDDYVAAVTLASCFQRQN